MPSDFLAIGHFCQDVTPNGYTIGGGAAYSTVTARNLGLDTYAVTSVAKDFNRQDPIFNQINITYHDSSETTIFDNQYDQHGKRHQIILGIGEGLTGRVIVFDALEMSFREYRIERDPSNQITWENRDQIKFERNENSLRRTRRNR